MLKWGQKVAKFSALEENIYDMVNFNMAWEHGKAVQSDVIQVFDHNNIYIYSRESVEQFITIQRIAI